MWPEPAAEHFVAGVALSHLADADMGLPAPFMFIAHASCAKQL